MALPPGSPRRPYDLDAAASVPADAAIIVDDGTNVQKATPAQIVGQALPLATENEAKAGLDNAKYMSALRTRQAIDELRDDLIAVASFKTVSDLLSDMTTIGYSSGRVTVQTGDVVAAGWHRYEVAAQGASDEHISTAGGVKLYVIPDSEGRYNVRAFGATEGVGNRTRNRQAIQAAVDAGAADARPTFVPKGSYYLDDHIEIPAECHLIGASRNYSVLLGDRSNNKDVLRIVGVQAKIAHLYLRDGVRGILHKSGTANQLRVEDCRISYNQYGIDMESAYISDFENNYISFNTFGIMCGKQSYQVNIRYNVIDNNTGGFGIVAYNTSGLVIAGNTIEGNNNRGDDPGSRRGCGMWLQGLNQRTVIRDNWFEGNGDDGFIAADLVIGYPTPFSSPWMDTIRTFFRGIGIRCSAAPQSPARLKLQGTSLPSLIAALQLGLVDTTPTSLSCASMAIASPERWGVTTFRSKLPVKTTRRWGAWTSAPIRSARTTARSGTR